MYHSVTSPICAQMGSRQQVNKDTYLRIPAEDTQLLVGPHDIHIVHQGTSCMVTTLGHTTCRSFRDLHTKCGWLITMVWVVTMVCGTTTNCQFECKHSNKYKYSKTSPSDHLKL